MRAAWYRWEGPAREVLITEEMPPGPTAGEMRILIAASGIAPANRLSPYPDSGLWSTRRSPPMSVLAVFPQRRRPSKYAVVAIYSGFSALSGV